VLTGHVLKDPDYVSCYHRGELSLGGSSDSAPLAIQGAFRNAPQRVAATKTVILENLERRRRMSR
jgi:hypothetical protein